MRAASATARVRPVAALIRHERKLARRAKQRARKKERHLARDRGDRKVGRGYDWARRLLQLNLIDGAPCRRLNACELARELGCHPQTIRDQIGYWRSRSLLRRTQEGGGRGRGSLYEIDQLGLARQLRECDRRNLRAFPPTPPIAQRSGHQVRADARNRTATSKPPSGSELHEAWQRAQRLDDADRQRRAMLRIVRLAAWRQGLTFGESQRLTAAVGRQLGRIGKASRRGYFVGDVLAWLDQERELLRESVNHWQRLNELARHGFPRPERPAAKRELEHEEPSRIAPKQRELSPAHSAWLRRMEARAEARLTASG